MQLLPTAATIQLNAIIKNDNSFLPVTKLKFAVVKTVTSVSANTMHNK